MMNVSRCYRDCVWGRRRLAQHRSSRKTDDDVERIKWKTKNSRERLSSQDKWKWNDVSRLYLMLIVILCRRGWSKSFVFQEERFFLSVGNCNWLPSLTSFSRVWNNFFTTSSEGWTRIVSSRIMNLGEKRETVYFRNIFLLSSWMFSVRVLFIFFSFTQKRESWWRFIAVTTAFVLMVSFCSSSFLCLQT